MAKTSLLWKGAMTWRAIGIAFLGLATLPPQQAVATTIATVWIECPLGGDTFAAFLNPETRENHDALMARRYLGDGIALSLEVCPNGFVIYKDHYSQDELKVLEQAIEEPDYKSLTESPTYKRLWWIRKRQGADMYELANLLGKASREWTHYSERSFEAKQSAAAEFYKAVSELPYATERSSAWFKLNLQAANLMRTSGRFGEALRLLDALAKPALRASSLESEQISTLRTLAREGNTKHFPTTLDSVGVAAETCTYLGEGTTRSELSYCTTSEVRRGTVAYCRKMAFDPGSRGRFTGCRYKYPADWILPPLAALVALGFIAAMLWPRTKRR